MAIEPAVKVHEYKTREIVQENPQRTSYPDITDPDYPGYAPGGAQGEALDGPTRNEGYVWWEVDYSPRLYTGRHIHHLLWIKG